MSKLHPSIVSITDNVIKPDVDKRQWRALKLSNEMNILIICDPETDKSAAAVNVHVGKQTANINSQMKGVLELSKC